MDGVAFCWITQQVCKLTKGVASNSYSQFAMQDVVRTQTVKNFLSDYNLPISLDLKNIPIESTKLQNHIYRNIFLDKKKIDKYPRYISIKKQGKTSIKEIKDFDFLNDTIIELMK